MSTVVQDELDAMLTDWRPNSVNTRALVRAAVMRCAAEHKGLVHASWIRDFLPVYANPQQVGATICALVRQGFLRPTGRYLPNGGTQSRNATKRAEVRRLVKPIPPA